jgi:UDP-2-acetamido-3-amino-2,3-dideoxy-glucuronate N-acetyltransferase
VGDECTIGGGVYVGEGVVIGNRVKIQNKALVYPGVSLEDGVFVGPAATFTNDLHPRAINGDGSLKGLDDWTITETRVRYGASIGAGAVIVCGVEIGSCARRLRPVGEPGRGTLLRCDRCGWEYDPPPPDSR